MAIEPELLKQRIESGAWDRESILRMRKACIESLDDPAKATEAETLLKVIDDTKIHKTRSEYVLMGYCPGGKLENALDEEWIKGGFCEFNYVESQTQIDRFFRIVPGDILILKIRKEFGKTMFIHAWGTVTGTGTRKGSEARMGHSEAKAWGTPYLKVDWHPQETLEVPLMGCNYTVNVKTYDQLKKEMPKEFWDWFK